MAKPSRSPCPLVPRLYSLNSAAFFLKKVARFVARQTFVLLFFAVSLFPFSSTRNDKSPNFFCSMKHSAERSHKYTSIDCVDGRNPIRTDWLWRSHNPTQLRRSCPRRRLWRCRSPRRCAPFLLAAGNTVVFFSMSFNSDFLFLKTLANVLLVGFYANGRR